MSVLDLHTATSGPHLPLGVELRSWVGAAPDELLGSLVRARNAMADAPVPGGLAMPPWTIDEQRLDEQRWIARAMPQHVTVALEDGEVLALTGIQGPDAVGARVVHTDHTATVPSARRQGLAVCVKLESLRGLRADRPDIERVATQNAAQNDAILAVNRKLGFVPVLHYDGSRDAVIKTGRLRLRRFREDDRETVARWNADPVFAEHLGGVHTRARSDEVFDRWQRHWDEHGFGSLGIEWAKTGELIGRTGPAFHSVWPYDPEVGWAVDRRGGGAGSRRRPAGRRSRGRSAISASRVWSRSRPRRTPRLVG